jgi:hypothetical protein
MPACLLVLQSGLEARAQAQPETSPAPASTPPAVAPEKHEGKKHPVLCYLPNRLFDLLDIVRLRVRVGPGLSFGIRATEVADLFMGAHTTIFVGLRGSRGRPQIPWPAGIENHAGIEVSVADGTSDGRFVPAIDPLEVGLEAHGLLVGASFALELFEVVDLAAGFFFIDLRKDDF